MKIFIYPPFAGEDNAEGGVRRVVEGQTAGLPRSQVKVVQDPGEADVIACHIDIPDEYLKRFPDKPFVSHNHGLYWSNYEWMDWAYKANRKVLRSILSADITTAPTEWVADTIRRHTSRDVRVVPHGVSLRDWQPPGQHRGYVLWNKTRIDPVCEIDSLNALVTLSPDIPFVSTFCDVKRPNVEVTGAIPLPQAKEIIRHAGVYLCTSRETFGVGTLEAMACGVPVVGYNFGGQAEYVEHEVDGYLVDPGDIQGLRDGILYCLENRERMSEAARKKAGQFTWAKAIAGYKQVYQDAIDKHAEMERNPRTTIVVPAFKLEQYLPATLESIEKQTDKDWECIVVDDASPDGCGAIADAWAAKDKRFRVIHNEANLYLAESRNVAIREAKGRYILPLDADDMLKPTSVQELADALDDDRTLQVAYGNVLFVNEDGKTPTDYRAANLPLGHAGWPMAMDPAKQVSGANLQPYASMFRKTAWEQVGGYRRRLKTAEDADFWTRLASWGFRSEMVTQNDTLIYRNREGSMSREQNSHRYDYLSWFSWSKDLKQAPAALLGERNVGIIRPHVSIIIPVGPGHQRYLLDAIDSVAAQSYTLWECIVVNDTGEILPPLPTWVYQYECNARDTGSARNIGLQHARGSVFLPLDADDFLQPNALEVMLAAYIERGGGCVIYPDMFEDPETEGVYTTYQFPDWSCANLTSRMIHSVTALTPVAKWREVGGYAEGVNWEDWDFQLRLAEVGVCSYRLAAPLFTYRKWTGTRRDYADDVELKARLATVNERWGAYRTGEKHFMACGCSGSTVTLAAPAPMSANGQASQAIHGETAMVEYIGNKQAPVKYKGVTGKIYRFAAGDEPMLVDGADGEMFSRLQGFRLIRNGSASVEAGQPVLSA